MQSLKLIQQQLAPLGVLRAAVNLSNPLLIKTRRKPKTTGVSPSLAAAIASKLEVPLELIEYEHPDLICAALEEEDRKEYRYDDGEHSLSLLKLPPWDIALIAADPDRASQIDFTEAYCEIQATCMVPEESTIESFDDVNQDGITVSVKGGGAYDLWLTRNWINPTYVRTKTLDESYSAYIDDSNNKIDVLAGLRPRLIEDLEKANNNDTTSSPRHRLLYGSFMAVQQSIGCIKYKKNNSGSDSISPGQIFLSEFVQEATNPGGLVESLIDEYGMTGRLSLPSHK